MSKPVNSPTDKHEDLIEHLHVDQRRHRRIPTNLNVEVTWVGGFGFEKKAAAVVKDISAGGFGIESCHYRPVGSRLTVNTQTTAMRCIVRHIREQSDGFYIGLEILPSVDDIAKTQESLESLRLALLGDSFE
jgi:hypothetical protein